MEASCEWFLSKLQEGEANSLIFICGRHRARDDDFSLAEVLAFLPAKQYNRLATLLRSAISSCITDLQRPRNENADSSDETESDRARSVEAIRAAAEIVWLHVEKRKELPCAAIRGIIFDLHSVMLALGQENSHIQNQIAKICEWLWHVEDAEREQVVPQTVLYLLLRSFKGESQSVVLEGKRQLNGGSAADVSRVYAMRQALDHLELSEHIPESATVRTLLLRCTTSALYLRIDHGRKFLAHLLTVEDMREAIFDALLNQLSNVRKQRASNFGTVFLMAWKLEKSEWFFNTFVSIAEKAIYAGSEPLATNLRTVLSSFHLSKRVAGVDTLLNRVYAPVLYKNLLVANPLVRKNAVTILADAFPIHDPAARLEEIEKTIAFQCNKLLDLLDDPSPMVRKATVEGTARILGLLWELVPLGSAKRMLDLMTSKLAFDAASLQVRVAVFEGLEFLSRNHLAHQILSIALKRLGCLIHDTSEKVRLSFLSLLLTLKSMRLRTLRYFDVVPLDDLLQRLPLESAAAATKIMELLISSYFPLEKKGKSSEEVASSQVRACLSMMHTSEEACAYFYRNLNLHIPPGPLCEFAMRMSALALEAPVEPDAGPRKDKRGRKNQRSQAGKVKRRSRRLVNDENQDPNDRGDADTEDQGEHKPTLARQANRVTLLSLVADVLVSIYPSLAKDSNEQLRAYIDEIFGGSALKPYLIERGNAPESRAACWRIASCISFSRVKALDSLWREQILAMPLRSKKSEVERKAYDAILSSLLICGVRWGRIDRIQAVLSSWADVAVTGHRAASIGTKLAKREKGRSSTAQKEPAAERDKTTRANALFALRSCGDVLLHCKEMGCIFQEAILEAPLQDVKPEAVSNHPVGIIRAIRTGCQGAIDFALESNAHRSCSEGDTPENHALLAALTVTWKVILSAVSENPTSSLLLEEVESMIAWSSGAELFENAWNLSSEMGQALSIVTLSFCADCTALGVLNEGSLSSLELLCKNIVHSIDVTDQRAILRPVVELVRISFQLFESYCLAASIEDHEGSDNQGYSLLSCAKSLLSTTSQVLRSCGVVENANTNRPSEQYALLSFLSDFILCICESSKANAFEDTLGESLRQCFENSAEAERNLMASTVCDVIRIIVTSTPRKARLAHQVFNTLLSHIFAAGEYPTASRAAVNFIHSLLNALYLFYEAGESTPDTSAREFFAAVEVAFTRRFPNAHQDGQNESEVQNRIHEINEILNNLKKICQTEEIDKAVNVDEAENSKATVIAPRAGVEQNVPTASSVRS